MIRGLASPSLAAPNLRMLGAAFCASVDIDQVLTRAVKACEDLGMFDLCVECAGDRSCEEWSKSTRWV